jgi:hypothetical protein
MWTSWIRRVGGDWVAVGQARSEAEANRRAEEVRHSAPWASCATCE